MPCRISPIKAVLLGLALAPSLPVYSQEPVKAYHQLSLPGFSLGYWSDIAREPTEWLGLGYRHSLISAFIGYSEQERLLERARWEVYVRIDALHPVDLSEIAPAAYSAVGWNVSFEHPGSVQRTVLIPYTGFELGVLTTSSSEADGIEGGATLTTALLLGLHLYSSPGFACALETAVLHVLDSENPLKARAGFIFSFVL